MDNTSEEKIIDQSDQEVVESPVVEDTPQDNPTEETTDTPEAPAEVSEETPTE